MRIIHRMQDDSLFTQAELSVRDYLLSHRDQIHSLSTDDVARQNYVSKATLTRFAKKLGCGGWNELRMQLMGELVRPMPTSDPVDADFPYPNGSTVREVIARLAKLKTETISACLSSLEPGSVHHAVRLLESQQRIRIFAKGYSLLASDDFRFRMMRLGREVENQSDVGLRYVARSMTPKDLAIVVSYTGRTESVVEAFRILKRRNVPIVAITNEDPNPIGDNATVALPVPREEDAYVKIGNYASVDSIRSVFDVLYSFYATRNPELIAERINTAKVFDAKPRD